MTGVSVSQTQPSPEHQMRSFDAAYREFLQTLHTLIVAPELQQHVAAAFAQYTQIVQAGAASAEAQRLASEAYARYLETLQRAITSEDTRYAAADAFRRYVRAVRDAWSELDPGAVEPAVVAAVGQTLTAAGWTAAGLAPLASVTHPSSSF